MTPVPPTDIFTRRVCLQLDGMDAVMIRRDVAYGSPDAGRRMDLYYPLDDVDDARWPAVIIVAGYPGASEPAMTGGQYKDIGWTVSMGQLIAVSGMVAIAYTNRNPMEDLHELFGHVRKHAPSLQIDPARIGVLAVSGNVPTALSTIMTDATAVPTCAAFGYGCLIDLDGGTDVADAAREFGFANPGSGRTLAALRRNVPMLITRAGRDQFPAMNASIDKFICEALAENLPITVVNYPDGVHAFDLFDNSLASRAVVGQTLQFLRQHLLPHRVSTDSF